MTTIAIDATGRIAWDSQITKGTRKGYSTTPKALYYEGIIVATAGDHVDLWTLADWWKNGSKEEDYPFDKALEFTAVILSQHHKGVCYETNNVQRSNAICVNLPHAIGSGVDFALAAMYLGCDAVAAVNVAAQFDACTGGDIDSMSPIWETLCDVEYPY